MSGRNDEYTVHENNVPDTYRDRILKWNGWGYVDSFFLIRNRTDAVLTGNRYDMSNQTLPYLVKYVEEKFGASVDIQTQSVRYEDLIIPVPFDNQDFINFLLSSSISFSNKSNYRLVRSHGHTVHDIANLRNGTIGRIPDIIVWPKSEEEVVTIIDGAKKFNVVIIPIGGGTSVTGALECPNEEARSICSLDMALMNAIIYIDDKNLLCRAQAGIIGQDLERQLNEMGYTCGHEPDSVEFSTLGGWISTRASGMKKNKYGNIEDLLVHVSLVTPKGIIRRQCQVPRISAGPDLQQIILGSEGILGVITEATVKIFPKPEVKKYGSFIFPTFEHGVNFFREVAKQRCQCASLRLVDNEQFLMGQALKTHNGSLLKGLKHILGTLYVTRWKNFKLDEIVAATCVYEGTKEQVSNEEQKLTSLAGSMDGISGGAENGEYGYRLTFAIAYLRDFGMQFWIMGESFETSVPWDKVICLCRNVKEAIRREGKARGTIIPPLATCRVTQVYDSGACVYFYYAFNYSGIYNPILLCDQIEKAARDEIIVCGGSISHHHGIGKLRKHWYPASVSDAGLLAIRALKEKLDPKNIFGSGNIIDVERERSKL
ncbi:alkyldihydroxyacetonephosphate synthase [Loa loa]|uniref:Alkylglycerone-phosphate synthase n=1 Tax=Loa loa TaxID=7209 RepID=A0A1I7VI88_LOALO|nr:alkyldihydroxyacetonephosphate synthase [Loa loa]EFO24218.1 alkyldihydroxyacetonephosphate synthase [Loa loa]